MLYFFVFLNQDNILLWFVRPRQLLLDRIELINLIVKTRVEVLEREMLWEHKFSQTSNAPCCSWSVS